MFSTENSLKRLKSFNSDLKNNFNYFEFHIQSLDYQGNYEGDEKFSTGYKYGGNTINQKGVDSTGNPIVTTPLNTLFIGKSYYNYFDDCIEEGRNFIDDDFIIDSPDKEINVILGNEYKDKYKVGDILTLSLHEKELNFKVIGFFKKGIKIEYGPTEVFDRQIIVPFYDINYEPTDEVDNLYQKIYYSQKNEGFIKSDEVTEVEQINILNKIDELANKYNLLYSISNSAKYFDFINK